MRTWRTGNEDALETALLTAWSVRFGGVYQGATIPATIVRELMAAIRTGDVGELTDAAQALGVLRAHEGRQVSAVVEDLLALRTNLWGRWSVSEEFANDPGELLMMQQQATDTIDAALRASVDAFVQESQRVLSRRATRDQLTGLLNRAAFDEALAHDMAARSDPPSVLFVDLDRFKQVNDRLGHLAGDAILVTVAALMLEACRAGDVVGRLGGDEFVVLLPATSPQLAEKVAQRLLTACARSAQMAPEGADRVGMSIGLAWIPRPVSADDLVHAADQAMYSAKRSGGAAIVRAIGRTAPC